MSLPIGRTILPGERFRRADVCPAWGRRRRRIIASYARTKNLETTAREFGISYQRVSQIIRRFGQAA